MRLVMMREEKIRERLELAKANLENAKKKLHKPDEYAWEAAIYELKLVLGDELPVKKKDKEKDKDAGNKNK